MIDIPGEESTSGYFLPADACAAVPSVLALPSSQAGNLLTEIIRVTRKLPDLQPPVPQPLLHGCRELLEC